MIGYYYSNLFLNATVMIRKEREVMQMRKQTERKLMAGILAAVMMVTSVAEIFYDFVLVGL